jgi:putative endonuclease
MIAILGRALESLLFRFSRDTGKYGEGAAARFLRRRGYRIRIRNFRTGAGEVDLIAERDGIVAAVEVKTRLSDRFGTPEEAVTAVKFRRVKAAAAAYCRKEGIPFSRLRIDVVAVERDGSGILIRHHENALGE